VAKIAVRENGKCRRFVAGLCWMGDSPRRTRYRAEVTHLWG